MLNWKRFVEAAEALGVALDERQATQLMAYHDLIYEWSARVRLVSRGDRERLLERHFLDCLAAVPLLPGAACRVLDIGSGAGLPGIPLKIARPDVQVVMLEPARMKALFLEEAVARLALPGASVIRARAEEIALEPGHRGTYDIVFARAVGALPLLWGWASPLLREGGRLVAFKAPGSLNEVRGRASAAVTATEHTVRLPFTNRQRTFAVLSCEMGGPG